MKRDIRQNLNQTIETQILRFILSGSAIFEPMISTRRVFHYPILLIFLLFSANGWAQKDPKGDLAKRRVEGESVFIDATKAEILEDLDAAFTLYQKAASLDPENAVAYFKMADILGKQNRFSEALVFSKKANEIEKKNAYFLIQLAQMQEITQDWKGAIDSYRKVMKE
ncbi:MAG TPA: tetratricopeptide repeat protein, partial [Catalimonadaceae bacterium]|nr:tetratricopeptide repeat protein [Catalimonadaceae bacterium]